MLKTLRKLGSKCATPLNTKFDFTLAEGATHVDLPPTKEKLGFSHLA